MKFQQASLVIEKNYSVIFKLNKSSLFNSVRANSSAAKAGDVVTPKGTSYKNLTIGVPRETFLNEKRVAMTPAVTEILTKKGFTINVEENAGLLAKFPNDQYARAGGQVVNTKSVYGSDIVLKVRSPDLNVINSFFKYNLSAYNQRLTFFQNTNRRFKTVLEMKQLCSVSCTRPRTDHLSMRWPRNERLFLPWTVSHVSVAPRSLTPSVQWQTLPATRQYWRLPTTLVDSSPVKSQPLVKSRQLKS